MIVGSGKDIGVRDPRASINPPTIQSNHARTRLDLVGQDEVVGGRGGGGVGGEVDVADGAGGESAGCSVVFVFVCMCCVC